MTTKRIFFLHEENHGYHQYIDLISAWEEKQPFQTMKSIFEDTKDDLQDQLKNAEDKLAALTAAEENGKKIRLDTISVLQQTIQCLQEQIDIYDDKVFSRIGHSVPHQFLDSPTCIPDEYPVGYILKEVEDGVGNSHAGDQEDHIFGIFTLNKFYFKSKGTINGREKSKDFNSLPYRAIFTGTTDPRIRLSEPENQSHIYDDSVYVGRFTSDGKVVHNGEDLGHIDEKLGFVRCKENENSSEEPGPTNRPPQEEFSTGSSLDQPQDYFNESRR